MSAAWYEGVFIYWRIVCVALAVLYTYSQYVYQSVQEGG